MMDGGPRKINYAEGFEGLYIDGTDRQACISFFRGVEASGSAMTIVHEHAQDTIVLGVRVRYSDQKRIGT